jgi:hypothetical protein
LLRPEGRLKAVHVPVPPVGLLTLAILFAACFAYDAKKMTAASI